MRWSTWCSKACVSTPDGRGRSWPPSAVENVYREFAVDHGTCHAFLYAFTQILCRPSISLCRAAEKRKAPIPFCVKNSTKSSGVSGWLWLDRVPLSLSDMYIYHVFILKYMYLHIYVSVYVCICISIHIYINLYIYVYINMYIYMYAYTYIYSTIQLAMSFFVCVCVVHICSSFVHVYI